jgi:hypothetical protein
MTGRNPIPEGPSWLTFLGQMKDSLWSIDLFRCESAALRTHWILVVMDQYARRKATSQQGLPVNFPSQADKPRPPQVEHVGEEIGRTKADP